jgi:uncharacterized protein (TIGR02270 family)
MTIVAGRFDARVPVVDDASPAALWSVVEEHFDEAAFYFERWEACLDSPKYTLDELEAGPEESLFAHLDGLLVAGDEARRRLLWPAVESARGKVDASTIVAATLALLRPESSIDQPVARLLWALSNAPERAQQAIARALGLADNKAIDEEVSTALAEARDASTTTQAALLAIAADRKLDPDTIIARYLRSDSESTLRAALRSLQHVASPALYVSFVEELLNSSSLAVRAAALETATLWNLPSAAQACLRMASDLEPHPLLMAALLGGEVALQCVLNALEDESSRPAALWALGFCGRAEAAESCIPHLDNADPTVARLAGEAFSAITGLDLGQEPYRLPEPTDDEDSSPQLLVALPETDDDVKTHADFLLPGTDDLPLPNASVIRQWWTANRRRFEPDVRYCAGQPWPLGQPPAIALRLPLRRRHAVLFELAIHHGGKPLATRSFSAIQRADFDLIRRRL